MDESRDIQRLMGRLKELMASAQRMLRDNQAELDRLRALLSTEERTRPGDGGQSRSAGKRVQGGRCSHEAQGAPPGRDAARTARAETGDASPAAAAVRDRR